jgi:CRISPR-associated protein Csm1
MKGAEESAKEEEKSKSHSVRECEKNAISFMGTPLHWEKEFPVVKQLKDDLVKLIRPDDSGELPISFVSKIKKHTANAKIKEHKITQVKTYWMLSYDLSRFKERIKNEEVRKMMDNCVTEVCGNKPSLNGEEIETDYHPLELWAFSARWAELETRTNQFTNKQ